MSETSLKGYVQNMLSSEDENSSAGAKTELSGKTGELEKENAELRAKIGELNEQIDASHQELGAYSNHKARLEQQLAEANASVAQLRAALETALHGLSTTHNLLATDRPDLMPTLPEDLVWMIDNSKEIETIQQALSTTPSQAVERQIEAEIKEDKWNGEMC